MTPRTAPSEVCAGWVACVLPAPSLPFLMPVVYANPAFLAASSVRTELRAAGVADPTGAATAPLLGPRYNHPAPLPPHPAPPLHSFAAPPPSRAPPPLP